tara:strand:+ start:189 stop:824 length:636 start_codon:yes stop_codon:yes gene_type:complete
MVDVKVPHTGIQALFPCPMFFAHRDTEIEPSELKDINEIIDEGMHENVNNSTSDNRYIFEIRLKKIKEFCEKHLKSYAQEIINPKEELDFYITQSWLNVTKPNENHHLHLHPNSIISGVFYIETVEDDKIDFYEPNRAKHVIKFEPKEFNLWNSLSWFIPATDNKLILFPSWLEHGVELNKKAKTNRVSISFNTFAKGTFGSAESLTELIL